MQKNRLLLPALEVAYLFQAIAHAPRSVITSKMLPLVRAALAKLSLYGEGTGVPSSSDTASTTTAPTTPTTATSFKSFASMISDKSGKKGKKGKGGRPSIYDYEGGAAEYWDDLCLARFLEGVCLRYVAYPVRRLPRLPRLRVLLSCAIFNRIPMPCWTLKKLSASPRPKQRQARKRPSELCSSADLGSSWTIDYELGRLLASQADSEGAKTEFELIISGRYEFIEVLGD